MSNYFKHKLRDKGPAVIIGTVIFGAIAITGFAILFGFIVMWLWNWLMPFLFGLPLITYWQAVGLFILAKIIFGFGGGGGGHKSGKKERSHRCESDRKRKSDFSKWEHYDKFWKEKGEKEYHNYIENLSNNPETDTVSDSNENKSE